MNGLLRRLKRRRAATADETPPGSPAASEPVDATVTSLDPSGGGGPSAEEQAREEELRRRRRDLPAGLDAEELERASRDGARPSALRRRVRYLRRARELLLRDLGGFYYELHRTGGGREQRGHRDILETKTGRLAALDSELRALEERLGQPHPPETVVREPGIGGTCPSCGELHASDAGWCARCGTALSERARRRHREEIDRALAERDARAQEAERERAAAVAAAPAPAAPSPEPPEPPAPAEPPPGERPADTGAPVADAPTSELPANGGDPVPTPAERRA